MLRNSFSLCATRNVFSVVVVAVMLLFGSKECHSFQPTRILHHPTSCSARSFAAVQLYLDRSNLLRTSACTISLLDRKDETDVEKENRILESDDLLSSLDPGILCTDLLALAVACEMMGLLDVLIGDPNFWKNGGWFQPIISEAPSTLPILLQRFSTNGVVYIACAASLGAYQPASMQSTKAVLTTVLKSAAAFSFSRVVLGVAIALLTKSSGELFITANLVELIRECYFVVLATAAGRYILYSLFCSA